jgi:hypothetical protein
MPAQFSLLLAGALLVGLPSPTAPNDKTTQGHPNPSYLEEFSAIAGKVVGAASFCDQISADRVSTATEKAAVIASLQAVDDKESSSARNLFANGAIVGMDVVRSGQMDCNLVEASLKSLERAEQDAPDPPSVLQD